MVQRCSCILLVEFRTKYEITSLEDTAEMLYQQHHLYQSSEAALEALKAMIDSGHRYKNLEKQVGLGASLTWGTSLSETW